MSSYFLCQNISLTVSMSECNVSKLESKLTVAN